MSGLILYCFNARCTSLPGEYSVMMKEKHPDIHFKIVEGEEGELTDWIQERRVDIGFISYQKGHNYQFLPVMDDELFAVLPTDHPLTAFYDFKVYVGVLFFKFTDNLRNPMNRTA